MILRNYMCDKLVFSADRLFAAPTARFCFIDESGQAVFKDYRGNYGTLRKRNGQRIRFSNKREMDEYLEK